MTSRRRAKRNAFLSFLKSKAFSGFFDKFLESDGPRSILPFLALGAGISLPVLFTTIWLHYVEMEIYRVNITAISVQLNELRIRIEGGGGFEVPDFPMTVIFFPTAKLTTDRGNCQLDEDSGEGIGLLKGQEKQLDRLVDWVKIINGQKKIGLRVKGFASRLEFSGFPEEDSSSCNLEVAKLRAEQVSNYLRETLIGSDVPVETETVAEYDDMDQERPYRYGQEAADPPSRGIHALNQAAYITISFR